MTTRRYCAPLPGTSVALRRDFRDIAGAERRRGAGASASRTRARPAGRTHAVRPAYAGPERRAAAGRRNSARALGQASAAHRVRRYRCRDRRDQRVEGRLLPAEPWDPPEELLYPIIDKLLEEWRAGFRPGLGGIRIVGSQWTASVHALKEFLTRNQVPYHFFDVESTDERGKEMRQLAAGAAALPLVITEDGERLTDPAVHDVARRVKNLKTKLRKTPTTWRLWAPVRPASLQRSTRHRKGSAPF